MVAGAKASRSQYSGHLVIQTRGDEFRLAIPYAVTMLKGSLTFDLQQTAFYAGYRYPLAPPRLRTLQLTNTFREPIALLRADFPDDVAKYFEVSDQLSVEGFEKTGKWPVFLLNFLS